MITSPRKRSFSLPVSRHFEFSRLQAQLIAHAYQVLIPVVSRPLQQPRSRRGENEPVTTTRGLRSQAGGG